MLALNKLPSSFLGVAKSGFRCCVLLYLGMTTFILGDCTIVSEEAHFTPVVINAVVGMSNENVVIIDEVAVVVVDVAVVVVEVAIEVEIAVVVAADVPPLEVAIVTEEEVTVVVEDSVDDCEDMAYSENVC